MDRLYDALDAFSSCTGIPVTVYDTENRITREFNAEQKVCRLFPHFSQSEGCQGYLTFSMDESFALGEPYIFFCPAGFVKIAVPILYNGARRGCVLAGPLVLGSVDEKAARAHHGAQSGRLGAFPRVALFLQNAKESTPEQIQKIATLLYASVLSSRQNWEEYEHIRARSRGQISAGETVQQFKLSVSTGGETEETLWQRLLAGLRERDREAVNEAASGLFDEFLLVEAGNFDLIRMRLIELFTMLSKAALDSGINLNKILAAGLDPLEALNQAQSVEELAVWTQKLIDHFFSLVPEPPAPVYSPLITQAIELIGERYAEKLTLRDVGRQHPYQRIIPIQALQKGARRRLYGLSQQPAHPEERRAALAAGHEPSGNRRTRRLRRSELFYQSFQKITGKTPRQFKVSASADKLLDNEYIRGFPVPQIGGK